MMTEAEYTRYTKDFNEACAGDGTAFGAFYDKYYEPHAVFEYIPKATKNSGKEITVAFWKNVHAMMQEATVISGRDQTPSFPGHFRKENCRRGAH